MKRAACLDALVEMGRDSCMAAEDSDAADLGPGVLLLSVHRVDESDHVGGEVSEPRHAAELCVAHGCSADRESESVVERAGGCAASLYVQLGE